MASNAKGLTRERIIGAAVAVADRSGLAGVSMRSVGRELGVEAMSLYHHVAGKEALLDAMVDWLMLRVEAPAAGTGWREGMLARCRSLREELGAHPWGLALVDSRRSPGMALVVHYEAVLDCLRRDGFSIALAAHAFSLLDAYVYGFVLAEQQLPFEPGGGADAMAEDMALSAEAFPRMDELFRELVVGRAYDYGAVEFEYGLELVLDGLASRLAAEPDSR